MDAASSTLAAMLNGCEDRTSQFTAWGKTAGSSDGIRRASKGKLKIPWKAVSPETVESSAVLQFTCSWVLVVDELYNEVLEVMDAAFRDFAAALPTPERVELPDGWAYRFETQDIYHTVVLKLALIQSSLRAALALNDAGFVLEQGMLQRIIEDANEDVLFLVLAVTNDTITPLHQRYLDAFWKEERFAHDQSTESNKNPDTPSRKKIRAYVANFEETGGNPSRAVELSKFIHRMYSGFVHGASPHIMELYVGWPPAFHTRGVLGTPRAAEYRQDLWNYMYRGLLSHIFVAKLFGSEQHINTLIAYKRKFTSQAGKDY